MYVFGKQSELPSNSSLPKGLQQQRLNGNPELSPALPHGRLASNYMSQGLHRQKDGIQSGARHATQAL